MPIKLQDAQISPECHRRPQGNEMPMASGGTLGILELPGHLVFVVFSLVLVVFVVFVVVVPLVASWVTLGSRFH